ncbi:hypothetical protein Moror_10977 [Moniliophthora roreri MCA 2997]|uniref:Uncharacterized protein n=2 Tax=Moniliophthora roreri TaxID=221103 RepID=V2WH77_MONRO|nr:hypothetical protein Moror_10977 [Moniliophthora roreri MCA 2997]
MPKSAPGLPKVPEVSCFVDFSVIQALGNDPTALGGLHDDGLSENRPAPASASDNESDSEVENEQPLNFSLPNDYQSGQLNAVTNQLHNRIEHELSALLPRLFGLDSLIGDIGEALELTSNIEELKQVVTLLHSHLKLRSQHPDPLPTPNTTPSPSLPIPPPSPTVPQSSLPPASQVTTSNSAPHLEELSQLTQARPFQSKHHPSTRQKRIRAPSPEKRSKRHNSNGFMP